MPDLIVLVGERSGRRVMDPGIPGFFVLCQPLIDDIFQIACSFLERQPGDRGAAPAIHAALSV